MGPQASFGYIYKLTTCDKLPHPPRGYVVPWDVYYLAAVYLALKVASLRHFLLLFQLHCSIRRIVSLLWIAKGGQGTIMSYLKIWPFICVRNVQHWQNQSWWCFQHYNISTQVCCLKPITFNFKSVPYYHCLLNVISLVCFVADCSFGSVAGNSNIIVGMV